MKGLIRIAAMRKPDDFHSPSAAALLSDIRALDVSATFCFRHRSEC